MVTKLSEEEKLKLENLHSKEKKKNDADRIKSILLKDEGWTYKQIAKVLRLHEETISKYVIDYSEKAKLKKNSGGSKGKLNSIQTKELKKHIAENIYLDSKNIITYINSHYKIKFTKSGMIAWLHKNGFSYKQPQPIPAKADIEKQKEFIEVYKKLKSDLKDNEVILFGDAVHPTMATKISHGWIKTGINKPIKTTASKTRANIVGAINLSSMDLISDFKETVNSETMGEFFQKICDFYKNQKVHLILDNGRYNTSKAIKEKAKELGIIIHYLPTYSPNLNPAERVWKVMNEHIRNNVFFESAKEFREKLKAFFDGWGYIKQNMYKRINDNFQELKPSI